MNTTSEHWLGDTTTCDTVALARAYAFSSLAGCGEDRDKVTLRELKNEGRVDEDTFELHPTGPRARTDVFAPDIDGRYQLVTVADDGDASGLFLDACERDAYLDEMARLDVRPHLDAAGLT